MPNKYLIHTYKVWIYIRWTTTCQKVTHTLDFIIFLNGIYGMEHSFFFLFWCFLMMSKNNGLLWSLLLSNSLKIVWNLDNVIEIISLKKFFYDLNKLFVVLPFSRLIAQLILANITWFGKYREMVPLQLGN